MFDLAVILRVIVYPDMPDHVLLPARNFANWGKTVADVVADVEDSDETAVTVLYAFDDSDRRSTAENLDIDIGETDVDALAARKSGVSAAIDRLSSAGFVCTPRGYAYEDDPADAILRGADDESVDRIYMYSRKRSPAGKAVFGSTLQRVILNASVPVVVVPSGLS
jgi:nucleotide-binding universal stress UspA family protein